MSKPSMQLSGAIAAVVVLCVTVGLCVSSKAALVVFVIGGGAICLFLWIKMIEEAVG